MPNDRERAKAKLKLLQMQKSKPIDEGNVLPPDNVPEPTYGEMANQAISGVKDTFNRASLQKISGKPATGAITALGGVAEGAFLPFSLADAYLRSNPSPTDIPTVANPTAGFLNLIRGTTPVKAGLDVLGLIPNLISGATGLASQLTAEPISQLVGSPETGKEITETAKKIAPIFVPKLAGSTSKGAKTVYNNRAGRAIANAMEKGDLAAPATNALYKGKPYSRAEDWQRSEAYIKKEVNKKPLTAGTRLQSTMRKADEQTIAGAKNENFTRRQKLVEPNINVMVDNAGQRIGRHVGTLRNELTKKKELLRDQSILDEMRQWEQAGDMTIGQLVEIQRKLNDNLQEFYNKTLSKQAATEGKAVPIAEFEKAVDAVRDIVAEKLNEIDGTGNLYSEYGKDYGALSRISASIQNKIVESEAATPPFLRRVSERFNTSGNVSATTNAGTLFPKLFNSNKDIQKSFQGFGKYGAELIDYPPPTFPSNRKLTAKTQTTPENAPVVGAFIGRNYEAGSSVMKDLRSKGFPQQEAGVFATKMANGIALTPEEIAYIGRHSPETLDAFRQAGLFPNKGLLPEFGTPKETIPSNPTTIRGNIYDADGTRLVQQGKPIVPDSRVRGWDDPLGDFRGTNFPYKQNPVPDYYPPAGGTAYPPIGTLQAESIHHPYPSFGKPKSPQELKSIIKNAGGTYKKHQFVQGGEPLVLFNSKDGFTYSLRQSEVTPENVKAKLKK